MSAVWWLIVVCLANVVASPDPTVQPNLDSNLDLVAIKKLCYMRYNVEYKLSGTDSVYF